MEVTKEMKRRENGPGSRIRCDFVVVSLPHVVTKFFDVEKLIEMSVDETSVDEMSRNASF